MVWPHAITLLGLTVFFADQLPDFLVLAPPANGSYIVVCVTLIRRLFDSLLKLSGLVQRRNILNSGSPFHHYLNGS